MCAAVSDSFERRRIALVIGNNKYKQSPLYNCVNDANDLSKALKSIGFLVTSKTDLNCEEMDKEIENFLESIHQGDLVLFFFSGHGVQRDEQNYLIPCDNDRILGPSDFKYRAINAQRFLDLMSDKNPFVIVYLLDCCRTDMLPNMTRGKASYASSTGLAAMSAKAGTLIAFACAPGTVAADTAKNGRNGMFTYHLLQNITRPEEEITLLLIDVANGVANDTNERQIPYTTSALRQRGIHLATRQKKATQPINYQEPSYSIGSASAVPKSTTTPFKALPKPGRAPKAVPQEFAAPGTCDKLYRAQLHAKWSTVIKSS
ncbi:unnamed protein product [Rotaria socialis]|uniref:Caspase family p20 domain-containing protein n=2 Tax=Rotaria socialis TaxID=392032 RepID=A0A820MUF7_9BILA|nr:unnamed protein product [Rotaria socialis]CAF4378083.1 unnamed protein product [Rotaria socialis]